MNNQIKITAARHPDIPAVLVLQSKYLVTNMNEEEIKTLIDASKVIEQEMYAKAQGGK